MYCICSFLLGIRVGHWWRFSAFVVFMRDAGWSFYLMYLFFVWRGVAWRGGALRVAFMGHWGGTLVAFTVLVVFVLGIGFGHL